MIHNSSVIDKQAKISKNVKIGPFCYIGPNVELADDVELISNVHIEGYTTIGKGTKIFPFASLGTQPQDLKFKNEKNSLSVGENNLIREYVTINPGTEGGGSKTTIGNNCLFMISSHVAHDCIIGDNVIIANNVPLGGHVTIEDNVQIGSHCSIYSNSTIDDKQGPVILKKNCRIGTHSTIMPGITIGQNSVVGAYSFVTNNISDNELWVGVPAKLIKKI